MIYIGSNTKKPLSDHTVYGMVHWEINHQRKVRAKQAEQNRLNKKLRAIEWELKKQGYCI